MHTMHVVTPGTSPSHHFDELLQDQKFPVFEQGVAASQ